MKKSLIIAFCALAITSIASYVVTKQAKPPAPQDSVSHNNGHAEKSDTSPETLPQLDLTNQAEVVIDIKDFAYAKPNIRVRKGTTVTWTNQDVMEHNVMEAHEDDGHAHDAPKASEVEPGHFASPLLKKGQSYSFTFDETGAFPYHCAPHPYMTGQVTVVE